MIPCSLNFLQSNLNIVSLSACDIFHEMNHKEWRKKYYENPPTLTSKLQAQNVYEMCRRWQQMIHKFLVSYLKKSNNNSKKKVSRKFPGKGLRRGNEKKYRNQISLFKPEKQQLFSFLLAIEQFCKQFMVVSYNC